MRVGWGHVELRIAEEREGLVRVSVFEDLFDEFQRAGAQKEGSR